MNAHPTRRHLEQTVFAATVLLLAGLLLAAVPAPGEAAVRVRVNVGAKRPATRVVVRQPAARVVVTKPAPHVVVSTARPALVAKPIVVVSAHDRTIARRIAARTSATSASIVALRARGWSWTRIGTHLHLNARIVAACVR